MPDAVNGRIHREASWSVCLPPRWEVRREPECTTFYADPDLGVLQISSALKDFDMVTNVDLMDFARASVPTNVELTHIGLSHFEGLTAIYEENEVLWQKWWLRSNHLLLFATYNGPAVRALTERLVVQEIVGTLLRH